MGIWGDRKPEVAEDVTAPQAASAALPTAAVEQIDRFSLLVDAQAEQIETLSEQVKILTGTVTTLVEALAEPSDPAVVVNVNTDGGEAKVDEDSKKQSTKKEK